MPGIRSVVFWRFILFPHRTMAYIGIVLRSGTIGFSLGISVIAEENNIAFLGHILSVQEILIGIERASPLCFSVCQKAKIAFIGRCGIAVWNYIRANTGFSCAMPDEFCAPISVRASPYLCARLSKIAFCHPNNILRLIARQGIAFLIAGLVSHSCRLCLRRQGIAEQAAHHDKGQQQTDYRTKSFVFHKIPPKSCESLPAFQYTGVPLPCQCLPCRKGIGMPVFPRL